MIVWILFMFGGKYHQKNAKNGIFERLDFEIFWGSLGYQKRLVTALLDHQKRGSQPGHRFSTFFTSLDKVLTENENGFGGNDQDVLCALGDITLSDSPTSDSFDLVVRYYNLEKELLRQTNAFSVNSRQHTCSNQEKSCRSH